MNAMTDAKAYALEHQMPVIVHASTIRIHSHSNSDKHELYRDENERFCALASDPFDRYRKTLILSGRVSEAELDELDKKAKEEVSKAHKKAMAAPNPDPASIFNFVLPVLPCFKISRWHPQPPIGREIEADSGAERNAESRVPPQSRYLSMGAGHRQQRQGRHFQCK